MTDLVVGADGYRGGWVAVALEGAELRSCRLFPDVQSLLDSHPGATVVAIDIPIGLPESGSRRADAAARRLLRPHGSRVFPTPPRRLLEAPSYAAARALAARLGAGGLSSQSYALAPKILEVDDAARADERIFEVHPEVSFAAMAGMPVAPAKKTWSGLAARRLLLARAGIALPDDLGEGGGAPPDDVVDAAAAAWSARRIAAGAASSLPSPPEVDARGRAVAIWY